jgi:hypothetical protein
LCPGWGATTFGPARNHSIRLRNHRSHREFGKLQFASDGIIPSEFTATRYICHAETYSSIHGRTASVPFGYRRRI